MANVIQESSISFTIHDLRRTFLTIAESLDIPAYAVKCLANHKMSNDVTAGYIVTDVEKIAPTDAKDYRLYSQVHWIYAFCKYYRSIKKAIP